MITETVNTKLTPQAYFAANLQTLELERKVLVDKMLSMKYKTDRYLIKKTLQDIQAKTKEINELKLTYQIK